MRAAWAVQMGGLCCSPSTQVHDQATTSITRADVGTGEQTGRLLIFLNPHSGAGKGEQIFNKKVLEKLKANNIHYELIITTGPNHAKHIVETKSDIHSFNGILILSGDGLVYEVLNGILNRSDREHVLQHLPIGIIPVGSGNGLLASVLHAAGDDLSKKRIIDRAIDATCTAGALAQPISLTRIKTDKENLLSFLSIGWGLMADIDIESEKWRKTLGSSRFVLGALVRSLRLRTYHGKLSFLPYLKTNARRSDPKFAVYAKTCHERMGLDASSIGPSTSSANTDNLDRDLSKFHIEENLPDINEEIPDNWTVIDEEFIGVYAVTLSHISISGQFMPQAKVDDDRIYLTYILKKDVKSKMDIISFLNAIDDAKHLDLSFVKTVEVSAFRLEPHKDGSYLVIDGEVIDATLLQASTTTLKTAIFSP